MHQPLTLPQADPDSLAHSREVAAFLRERIAETGSISFAEFMHHALYAPGLGYYTAGSTKFGEEGDYITAPEVSAVFGHVLARQCAEVLEQVEGGAILEYGAGSGKLAFGHPELSGAVRTAGDQRFEIFVDHDRENGNPDRLSLVRQCAG